jgi:hypothetical protein
MTKFINNENVLIILIDAFKSTIDARKSENYDVFLSEVIIDFVIFSCMEYIGTHAAEIFEGEKINCVSKETLMRIIENIAQINQ